MTTITVCTTCRQPAEREAAAQAREAGTALTEPCGEALLRAVEIAAAGAETISVRGVSCLMACGQGCNAAVSGAGKMAYVLGRFAPDQEAAEALVDYAAKHAQSDAGVVPFKTWPAGVKGHFIARIPPVSEA